ncbi:MAG: glutamine--fructose-6-phosphate transaminase (isomerizing) [Patescibacteria group bacterium UBA2163]
MCGIVGYVGKQKASPILLQGLFTLEYRGYDSAGIKVLGEPIYKTAGPVSNLAEILHTESVAQVGIAHTRWATHGPPTKENAHPHCGVNKKVWLVHNGIIENYRELKKELEASGCTLVSDTDSEVLAQLIEREYTDDIPLSLAVRRALTQVTGAYGVVVFSEKEPDTLIAARMGSPLLLGVGEGEYLIASDASAVLKHTSDVIYLEDGELAVITKDEHHIETLDGVMCNRASTRIEHALEDIQKDGYPHFMLKEIHEAPTVVENTLRGRISAEHPEVRLGGLDDVQDALRHATRIHVVGCGSAYYAGLYGKYILEELTGIPVSVDLASEFRYRDPILHKGEIVLAISQSGETADTLEAIREAKRKGILTLGIVNVVGSSIAREVDAGVYNHAGPEVSVASTKAFISQMVVLNLIGLYISARRSLSKSVQTQCIGELLALPKKIHTLLENVDSIKTHALRYDDATNALFLGRKYHFPIALEGALKLKEVSYIHAEGYAAGEMKHGPLALIDEHFPVIALAPGDSVYEKMRSNIEEVRARGGRVLVISDRQDGAPTNDLIVVPQTIEQLAPILHLIPLQLLAYYVAAARGVNVDRPRNLAKSVTVE